LLDTVLNHFITANILGVYFYKIHFNIIFQFSYLALQAAAF